MKILGLKFQENLGWDWHIENVKNQSQDCFIKSQITGSPEIYP